MVARYAVRKRKIIVELHEEFTLGKLKYVCNVILYFLANSEVFTYLFFHVGFIVSVGLLTLGR